MSYAESPYWKEMRRRGLVNDPRDPRLTPQERQDIEKANLAADWERWQRQQQNIRNNRNENRS